VSFADGLQTGFLQPKQLQSSGRDETGFLADAMKRSARELQVMLREMPCVMRDALATVRTRVRADKLPLLSLLQANPLRVQSSHLSFQEYHAACAICAGSRLSGAPPWQWPSWWANSLRLGVEMGEPFARGLLKAVGLEDGMLDLSNEQVSGHPLCSGIVIGQLMASGLHTLKLESNYEFFLSREGEGSRAIIEALKLSSKHQTLTSLSIARNSLKGPTARTIAEAVDHSSLRIFCSIPLDGLRNSSLTHLSLAEAGIGVPGAIVLARVLPQASTLTSIDLRSNELGSEGLHALSRGLRARSGLVSVNLANNELCDLDHLGRGVYTTDGMSELLEALKEVGSSIMTLDLTSNVLLRMLVVRKDGRGTAEPEVVTSARKTLAEGASILFTTAEELKLQSTAVTYNKVAAITTSMSAKGGARRGLPYQ